MKAISDIRPEAPVQVDQIEAQPGQPGYRRVGVGICVVLLLYLCWRIVAPFLPAICWAFALALVAEPIYAWLIGRAVSRNLAALTVIILAAIIVIAPGVALAGALAREASDIVNRVATEAGARSVREAIEASLAGPAFRWLSARYDLLSEAMQVARSVAGWASATVSSVVTGSIWFVSQAAVAILVLFYFLRDGQAILTKLRSITPLSTAETNLLFTRIAQVIRVSLGGKLVVAAIQGALGGVMFGWLGLPAPVFWGCMMAVCSVFPVIGAFVVWIPAAFAFAVQGDWRHAVILVAWGVLIIHPVDNLLGPVLVGSTLRIHTLLMFFSIIGGIAAFGVSGVVIGPVTVALAVGLTELAERSLRSDASS